MTATTAPIANDTTDRTLRNSLRRTTATVGVAGAAAVTAAAAAAHGAGVSFEVDGEMIPLVGFTQMTLLGAIIGGLLLAVLNRRSGAPRAHFIRATAALTALSCIPSLALPDDAATKVALVATHLVAAVLIVPALARHAAH